MIIYDLVHAYQPFHPQNFLPPWVKQNLREIFVPLSRASEKGFIKRGVQLQGWTIEEWLKCPDPVKSLAQEVLENLQAANEAGFIEIGASAYSHLILPLVSDSIVSDQIKYDLEVIENHLGKPTWFWFPEGAVDGRTLGILHDIDPDLIAVVPDGALGKVSYSGFAKIIYEDGSVGRVVIPNTILKDTFMNAPDYPQKPDYVPVALDWEVAQRGPFSGEALEEVIKALEPEASFHILARDWENAGSKYGLKDLGGGEKEVQGLLELKADFKLLEEVQWERVEEISISDLKPSSWEPLASEEDPFPYWEPRKIESLEPALAKVISAWKKFQDEFNRIYDSSFPKESMLVLASDVPWHFLGRKEWSPNPAHSQQFLKKVAQPIIKDLGKGSLLEALDELISAVDAYIEKNFPRSAKKGTGPHPS